MIRIAVDGLGGDHAPDAVVAAVVEAARSGDAEYKLLGPVDQMRHCLEKHGGGGLDIELIEAGDKIEVSENPALAIRRKKDSTIVCGLNLVKQGLADAFISAGSTGALMAGSLLILGRIPGVKRPAIPGVLTGLDGKPMVMLDLGANVEVDVENLVQFAVMGSAYAECVLSIQNPSIGLLNVGTEANKGNAVVKETFDQLRSSPLNFYGNIEAREFFRRPVDVVVCDGFSGNIALKSMEGLVEAVFTLLKQEIAAGWREKLGAWMLKPALKKVSRRLDYRETGGAPLLGINGVCIKCHGSSNSLALRNGLDVAKQVVDSRLNSRIQQCFQKENILEKA